MSQQTFVFTKDALTDTEVLCDISDSLKYGETLVSITVQAISPVSTPPLAVQLITAPDDAQALLTLSGGAVNVSYGFQLLIVTNARQLTALVAVAVEQNVQVPYTTQNPEVYVDLVDTIEAGKSAMGTAVFSFPSEVDPKGGYVNWEFLDADGTVYSSGNAISYEIQSNGISNVVFAKAVINVPSSVPPSDVNSKYQLRYTLEVEAVPGQQSTFYTYENITVIGLTTVPLGTQDSVELVGNQAQMSVVIADLYDTVEVQLFGDNTLLGSTRVKDFVRVSSGFYYSASFETTNLPTSLEPYTVIWRYSNSINPGVVYSEKASLWIVPPTVLGAVSDVKAKINKARTTLYGEPDLLFPEATVMLWLRRARDAFNGAPGGFTSFTMLNAKGSIREYWLLYAEKMALESQYLAEGEKAFNFSGAAISLDVDRTSFLDNMASKIQGQIDNEIKAFRQNLIIKGNTSGDGSADLTRLRPGSMGAVGITITPASPWGAFAGNGFPYPAVRMGTI